MSNVTGMHLSGMKLVKVEVLVSVSECGVVRGGVRLHEILVSEDW